MADALDRLYDLFQDAPELGSLIDPRAAAGEGLWAVDADELLAKLDQALQREAAADPAAAVFGAAAAGTAKAAQLLCRRYWLVTTNPPFLGDGKQMSREVMLRSMAHPLDATSDLATGVSPALSATLASRWSRRHMCPASGLTLARTPTGAVRGTSFSSSVIGSRSLGSGPERFHDLSGGPSTFVAVDWSPMRRHLGTRVLHRWT